MNRTIATLASAVIFAFSACAAVAKEAPKAYPLKSKTDVCKTGYERVEVESVKKAADGSITFKHKGQAPMGPVPKKFATQYASMKAGDIQCLPGSSE